MANHGCINGTVDDIGYSSPVPVIGLYIAAASLLCMLLMLCDIVAGLCARKQWLPCKLFTLNSVTLTLFSIAAKLPVDLTTPMPSPSDQLSKLSGTAFICVSMCFLMPSLGVNPASESFTNMVALTIFVVTISVNICMQLATGVIALFFTEHIIVLCSLFVMLLIMWQFYLGIADVKKVYSGRNKEIFTKGDGSVFQRLRDSYLYGYCSNTQLVANLLKRSNGTVGICTLCCGTLIQAAFRSVIQKDLEFCSGNSDYEWSMPLILITQTLTVFIGTLAVSFRSATMVDKCIRGDLLSEAADKEADEVILGNPILGITSNRIVYRYRTRQSAEFRDGVLRAVYSSIFRIFMGVDVETASDEWLQRKSHEDVEKWIEKNKSEPSPSHLSQLLISAQNYPLHQFDTMKVIDPSLPDQEGVYVSSLSILLVARIAQVALPENRSTSLIQAFNEAKQVFYYVEKNITRKSPKNVNRLLFAKSAWAGQEFSCLVLPEIFNIPINPPTQSDLARALSIITHLKSALPSDPVWDELGIIVDFINRKAYSTIEELVTSMRQLFVDMVRVMLSQIPQAIFKNLNNSIDEEYQENVKLALKILCKVELFEGHIQWSFPPGCNFTSLANTDAAPPLDTLSQV